MHIYLVRILKHIVILWHEYSRTTLNLFYCTCAFKFTIVFSISGDVRMSEFRSHIRLSDRLLFSLFCKKSLHAVFTCRLRCILNRSMGVFSNCGESYRRQKYCGTWFLTVAVPYARSLRNWTIVLACSEVTINYNALNAAIPSAVFSSYQSINQSISLIATLRPKSRIANDMQLK